MDAQEFRLLNEFQRDFPLCGRPYREVGRRLGKSEQWVMASLAGLRERGFVGRVGAVFAPRSIGASTLAALTVPPCDLARVARLVNGYPEVNHNYQRDHAINLWFVVAAADDALLARALSAIELQAGSGPLLSLPLIDEYGLDLGFDLHDGHIATGAPRPRASRLQLCGTDKRIVAALQDGLALVSRPYATLGSGAGLTEADVITRLRDWHRDGVIRRFGIIVRHRPLGFEANAMVVWDVPDDRVAAAGCWLARQDGVTLCYRRRRSLPAWRYNLYCMVHGRQRDAVLRRLQFLTREGGLEQWPREVLFSVRAFKQRAAQYVQPEAVSHA
jgi:DNA-binding Lrp family transcriptional regulator